ncbi:MAG: hypothetical protein AAB871_02875 [Patescibacteria group bacterium]|mgnify:CR=1 FL=1
MKKIKKTFSSRGQSKKNISWLKKECHIGVTAAVLLLFLTFAIAVGLSADNIFLGGRSGNSHPAVLPGGSAMMETLSYHAIQSPADFPEKLLKNKIGDFVSSQQISDRKTGTLKFASFKSSLGSQGLLGYYREYLAGQSYQNFENFQGGSTRLLAQRGNISLDLYVQPVAAGSLVAIYYRVMK